jgi:hypothetical protein
MVTRNRAGNILHCRPAHNSRADSPRPAEIDQNLRAGPAVHGAFATLVLTQPGDDCLYVEVEGRG